MKSVLLSIRLKYFYLTYKAIKKFEIRKSMPKDFTGTVFEYISATNFEKDLQEIPKEDREFFSKFKGKVGLEFTLNTIEKFNVGSLKSDDIEKLACLSYKEMIDYFYKPEELDGNHSKIGYAWHIDDLIIYDKPKELSDFKKENKCHYADYEKGCCFENCTFYDLKDCDGKYSKIYKAPQSWCYVEEEI